MTSFRFLVGLVTATVGSSLVAADPVAPLRPLVPPDATVVFVVRNLGPQLKALGESPMAAWLATSPLVKQFVDPKEAEKLIAVRDFVTGQLGVTSDELRDDIFGEAVVFAFQPGDPGKPETDGGTMFWKARRFCVLMYSSTSSTVSVFLASLSVASSESKARDRPSVGGTASSSATGVFANVSIESDAMSISTRARSACGKPSPVRAVAAAPVSMFIR